MLLIYDEFFIAGVNAVIFAARRTEVPRLAGNFSLE